MAENILVTGGAGFIGSHLCEKLLSQGNQVVCLDNLTTGNKDNLATVLSNERFIFLKGDSNTSDLDKLFTKYRFDKVFHYSAVVGVKRTIENPLSVLNDLEGIKRVLELSRKYDVGKVIFASSSEVYGEPVEIPEREDGVMNAKMPYALVKLMGEKYLEAFFSTYGLKTTSLRFFNVYGPRQISSAYGFVAGIFINQVLNGQNPTIFGDGEQTRDFVFIQDNIKASLIAAEKKSTDGEAINIGTGKSISILELANKVISVAGKQSEIRPAFLKPRPNDIKHRCPSVDKMKRLLGYEPDTSLDKGLKITLDWFSEKYGKEK